MSTLGSYISETESRRSRKLLLDSKIPRICHVRLHLFRHELNSNSDGWHNGGGSRCRYICWKAADAKRGEGDIVKLRLSVEDLEEREVPLQESTHRSEIAWEVCNSEGAANSSVSVVRRVSKSDSWRVAAVEGVHIRSAIARAGKDQDTTLEIEIRLMVILVDRRRDEVPAQRRVQG